MGICTGRALVLLPTSSSKLLQSGKVPLRSHCDLGKLTMKSDKWIEVMHYKYTIPLSLKHGERLVWWLLKTHLIRPWFLVEAILSSRRTSVAMLGPDHTNLIESTRLRLLQAWLYTMAHTISQDPRKLYFGRNSMLYLTWD